MRLTHPWGKKESSDQSAALLQKSGCRGSFVGSGLSLWQAAALNDLRVLSNRKTTDRKGLLLLGHLIVLK